MADRTLGDLINVMSPWRIDCAERCMAQFAFRYLDKMRSETMSVVAAFGSAVDEAANSVYREKLAGGNKSTASADDTADRFASSWDYNAMAVDEWGDDKSGVLLDRGVRGVKLWRDQVAQYVDPIKPPQLKVTKTITSSDGDRWDLMGYMDLHAMVRGVEVVADMKAPGKRYSESRLLTESQPVAYVILADVRRFEFHVVTNTPTPVIQIIGADIDQGARDFFLNRVGMLRRNIRRAYMSGDWLPNRQHVLCKRRYCDKWRACEKRFGGQVTP